MGAPLGTGSGSYTAAGVRAGYRHVTGGTGGRSRACVWCLGRRREGPGALQPPSPASGPSRRRLAPPSPPSARCTVLRRRPLTRAEGTEARCRCPSQGRPGASGARAGGGRGALVPLPARCGFWAAPGGVAVEALVRPGCADRAGVRRAVGAQLEAQGVPLRELRLTEDRAGLRRPLPLRGDLHERSFAPPPARDPVTGRSPARRRLPSRKRPFSRHPTSGAPGTGHSGGASRW
jgi:hypothetical protein